MNKDEIGCIFSQVFRTGSVITLQLVFSANLEDIALHSYGSRKRRLPREPFDLRCLVLTIISAAAGMPSEILAGNGVTVSSPSRTDAKAVTDNVNGVDITNSYGRLEDGQSPRLDHKAGKRFAAHRTTLHCEKVNRRFILLIVPLRGSFFISFCKKLGEAENRLPQDYPVAVRPGTDVIPST
jgi:hypothetical protein